MRLSRAATAACLLLSAAAWAAPQPLGASALVTVTPKAFLETCRADIGRARAEIARLKAMTTPDAVQRLEAYDAAVLAVGSADTRAGLAHETHPDKEMREAAATCDQETSALFSEFSLDRGIYDALAKVDPKDLDEGGRYYLQRTLLKFRLAGVDRDEATRARLKTLNDELVKLSQEFSRNVREGVLTFEATPAQLAGLPEDFIKAHAPNASGKVVLKTDNPDYMPFISYAKDGAAREAFWKIYRQRAHPKNQPVLDQILAKRHEKAQLLGFANWADFATADRMIGTGGKAHEFIEKITVAADARAKQDYQTMLARKKKDDPAATDVKPWDWLYLRDLLRAENYSADPREVRPYFQYDNVKNSVLQLTAKLFGIRYQRVADAKVWHPTVETYDVYDGSKLLGRVYLDMFPREDKYKHYAAFTVQPGKAGVALPEGALICNFRQPTANDPGLLEYTDLVTFLHEFGHLVHGILAGQSPWAGKAWTGMEWDFGEAPSQMLEEWARDPKTLQTLAIHYQTKQPIPLALAEKLSKLEEVDRGIWVRQQMFYAATSLQFHNRDPKSLDTSQLSAQLQEKYTPFKYVPGTYYHSSFDHLTGYSAAYYTYMWSLVIAKDMFSAFTATGDIMKPETAMRYRRTVLEPTGSKPAAQLVQDFLGRPYGFKAYEEWLNKR